eukprot:2183516-Heterocapsa_arctica.AAC.1
MLREKNCPLFARARLRLCGRTPAQPWTKPNSMISHSDANARQLRRPAPTQAIRAPWEKMALHRRHGSQLWKVLYARGMTRASGGEG